MSDFLKDLQQPEYVHVVLNHLPLTGLCAAVLCLAGALVLKSRPALFLGLTLVFLFSMSAWPVYEYGQQSYDRVLSMADEDGGKYLARHAAMAGRWLFLFFVTAALAAGAMIVGWKRPRFLTAAVLLVLLLALGSLGAGAVIADCGGKIRHREFRVGPAPAEPQNP